MFWWVPDPEAVAEKGLSSNTSCSIAHESKYYFNLKKVLHKNWFSRSLLYNRVLGLFPMYSGASGGDEDLGELGLFSLAERVMLDQHLANISPLLHKVR